MTPTDSLLPALEAERLKYGTTMTDDECVNLLNSVAWQYRDLGWGLSGKTAGDGIGIRYDDVPLSHDCLHNKQTNHIYDCLVGAGAQSTPGWSDYGENTQGNRPWTAPIEGRDPDTAPVFVTTALGATCFSLVDLYARDRTRGDETLRWFRDELGATFLRVFWNKGTGAPGDYWLNEGAWPDGTPYYSCVRHGLAGLPVSLMQETMAYARSWHLKIAHCIFADNLGLTPSDAEAFVHGFLDAEADYRDVTEYIEVFNEPYTRGGGHGGAIPDLHRYAAIVRSRVPADVLLALGTPQQVHMGDDALLEQEVHDMYGACPDANLITVHFSRETNRPPPDLSPWAPTARASGEPRGPGSSVDETSDPDTLAGDFAATNAAGYEWYVYHSDAGIRPRSQEVWEVPNAAAIRVALQECAYGAEGAPAPPDAREPSTLASGAELLPGDDPVSPSARFELVLQDDGNLVLYDREGDPRPVWHSATPGTTPKALAMQTDGNLVLYDVDGFAVWATMTTGDGATLELTDAGAAVVRHAGAVRWSSGAVLGPTTLASGAELLPGDALVSADGRFALALELDGNVTIRDRQAAQAVVWATGTAGIPPKAFAMQGDGNLVLYEAGGASVWATMTTGTGAILELQDQGNAVIYHAGAALWATSGGVI